MPELPCTNKADRTLPLGTQQPPRMRGAAPDVIETDVVIVGGGVNGTGVARDLALRGVRCVLFEKNDLGFGASGNSSGMIHGGPRYLLDTPRVTESSSRDAGYVCDIAKNHVFRIPFLMPVPAAGLSAGAWLAAYDGFFAFYDRYQALKQGKRHTRLSERELLELEPGLSGRFSGAVTFDEWGIDGARLCVLNALDASERGARVFVHHEVQSFTPAASERERTQVRAVDVHSGRIVDVRARFVVNATGAWSSITAALFGVSRRMVRPGKGIHVVFDRRLSNYAVVCTAIDGRQIFVMPWGNISWIATTDDDYYGDLDRMVATTDEVRYLVDSVASIVPAVRNARVVGTTAGARPTLFEYGRTEDSLSREHEIIVHEALDGVPGLYSMVGGKLASYRMFAEEMSNLLAERLGVDAPCSTHLEPLPGNETLADPSELAGEFGVSSLTAAQLCRRYGTRARRVLELGASGFDGNRLVCTSETVLESEVRYAVRHEAARTLADVARRTRLGLGICGGSCCAMRAAAILAEEYGQQSLQAIDEAVAFMDERRRSRAIAASEAELAQEEFLAGSLASLGAFTNLAPAIGDPTA